MDIDGLMQQPCPCGSGRAFGDCCAPARVGSPNELARAITEELKQGFAGQSFASEDEMQAFLDARVADHNRHAREDFDGLSPTQMSGLLYQPFEVPPLAGIEERVPAQPNAPILALFDLIAEASADNGVKLTARGNLPLKLVKAAGVWLREQGARRVRPGSVNTERDVDELHVTRVVADLAGLLRKTHGRLHLTRAARRLIDRKDRAGLYRRLLETYCRRFNWAYRDGFEELPIIRDSFGFVLYLLHRHGHAWRPAPFYEDAFLRAFPMVVDEADNGDPYFEPVRHARLAWTVRALEGFGWLFGLVELAGENGGPVPLLPDQGLQVRAAPLLADVFPHPPPESI